MLNVAWYELSCHKVETVGKFWRLVGFDLLKCSSTSLRCRYLQITGRLEGLCHQKKRKLCTFPPSNHSKGGGCTWIFFHKNDRVILNKALANDSPYKRLRPWFRLIKSICVLQFLISLLTLHHASYHWQQEPNHQLNVAFFSSRYAIWKAELLTKGPLSNQTKWQGKWLSRRTSHQTQEMSPY